jgi:hypothetical protein
MPDEFNISLSSYPEVIQVDIDTTVNDIVVNIGDPNAVYREIERAMAAEAALSAAIINLSAVESNHFIYLDSKTDTISSNLDAEIVRATDSENALSVRIDNLSAQHISDFDSLSSALTDEINRAISVENTLSASIISETDRAIFVENSLSAQIINLSAVESNHFIYLDTKTNTISSKLDAEIDRAISVDDSLSAAIVSLTLSGANNTAELYALSATVYEHIALDDVRDAALSAQIISLSAKEQADYDELTSAINQEAFLRATVDQELADAIESLSSKEQTHFDFLSSNIIDTNVRIDNLSSNIDSTNVRVDELSSTVASNFDFLSGAITNTNLTVSNLSDKVDSNFIYLDNKTNTLSTSLDNLSAQHISDFNYLNVKTDTLSAKLDAEIVRSLSADASLSAFVPYVGATQDVSLGAHSLSSNTVRVANGTVAAPNYSFVNDTNTGSADVISIATGGQLRMFVGNLNTTILNEFYSNFKAHFNNTLDVLGTSLFSDTVRIDGITTFANGNSASPSITFTSDTNTGIFRSSEDNLSFATGGLLRAFINSNGTFSVIGNGTSIDWNSAYTNVKANSAGWESNKTTVNANSGRWESAYTTVNANSAQWSIDTGSDVSGLSSNWQNTFTTVNANSANWNSAYNTVKNTSGNYVPYTGATQAVNLGAQSLTSGAINSTSNLLESVNINGTHAAAARLTINHAVNSGMVFKEGGVNKWTLANTTGGVFALYNDQTSSNLITILPNGSIGIGTQNPVSSS